MSEGQLLERVEELYRKELSCSYIAAEINEQFPGGSPFSAREIRTLVNVLKKIGRIKPPEQVTVADIEDRVLSLRMEGDTAKEISHKLGVSVGDVHKADRNLTKERRFPNRLQEILGEQRSRRRRERWWVDHDQLVQSTITLVRQRYSFGEVATIKGIPYSELLEAVKRIRHKYGDTIFIDPNDPVRTLKEAATEAGLTLEEARVLCHGGMIPHEYREGNRPKYLLKNEGVRELRRYVPVAPAAGESP